MSWELGSFAILAVALAAGFWWWERRQPSSRVLALVATLAALAALGRIAFAPLPNVKPTTDIVLLSGFVLGPAPGFAVGAVAAIASNIVFGQGPWTPWQMAAWGLVGAGGGALGALTARRLGRLPLALCCGLAGLIYGAILDYSTWATFSGEHTLGQYVAISGASLPFNLAHAGGNVVFCLAFGPAFVRALSRFRARFEIRWVPAHTALGAALAALVMAAALAGGVAAPADAQAAGPAARAKGYLLRAQNSDGGFGAAPGQRSSDLYTAWVAIGLASAGVDPDRVHRRGGRSLGAYVAAAAGRARDAGDVERALLALRAAGHRTGALRARLHRLQLRDGSFAGLANLTAFGVLALRAAGDRVRARPVRRAAHALVRRQNRDGGWNFARRGLPSRVDETAAALQALRAAGWSPGSRALGRGARWLVRRQNRDGGFPTAPGSPSNAQSTAWAVQGLVAAGRNPARVRRGGSRSPLRYLSSLVTASGAVRYSRTSAQTPVWVTAQALAALQRRPLPVRGR
jgi:energy-coupling factor transport system substrate-specific component